MITIGIMCTALGWALLAGLYRYLRGWRVAQDAKHEGQDPLSKWLKELPEVRSEDVFVDPVVERSEEVPAR